MTPFCELLEMFDAASEELMQLRATTGGRGAAESDTRARYLFTLRELAHSGASLFTPRQGDVFNPEIHRGVNSLAHVSHVPDQLVVSGSYTPVIYGLTGTVLRVARVELSERVAVQRAA